MISFSDAKSILETLTAVVKKTAMLDLEEKIISLREFIVSVKDENISLKEENQALKRELSIEADYHLRDGIYWKDNDPVPFCQKCLDGSKKPIHLQKRSDSGWRCLECTNSYGLQHAPVFNPASRHNPGR